MGDALAELHEPPSCLEALLNDQSREELPSNNFGRDYEKRAPAKPKNILNLLKKEQNKFANSFDVKDKKGSREEAQKVEGLMDSIFSNIQN